VPGFRADENFREFHDESAGQRAAGNDRRERPPEIRQRRAGGIGEIAEQKFACGEGGDDGKDAIDPDQIGQRRFPVEIFFAAGNGFG